MSYKYLITKKSDFEGLVQYLDESPIFAYDTETNGKFSRLEVQLVGMSFGVDDFSCYIPLAHTRGSQLELPYVMEKVRPLFQEGKEFVAHNAKFDEMVLDVHGVPCRGIGHDTYIMAWLLNENRGSKGLKFLVQRDLSVKMETYDDVISRGPKKRGVERDYNFAKVRLQDALSYASDDAFYTLRLFHLYKAQLVKEKLWAAYANIERPLSRVVGNMEKCGVKVDLEYLDKADKMLPDLIEEIEAQIYEQTGEVFNIGSGQQLGRILFDKLGIGSNVPRTSTGNYATNKKTLQTYASKHKVVDDILRRKKVQKTHSTFVEGLKGFIEKDGRVHPSFNPCGTVTGRFSGREPNLQQIEGDEVETIKVRNFFVPSEGCVFVAGDYSQIELRILAHLSRDKNMIQAFLSGRDFHDETARLMLKIQGTPVPEGTPVTHRQRFNAKALNFGIPYGRGPASVAEVLGIESHCDHWPHMIDPQGKRKWWSGEKEKEVCHNCGKCFIEDWFAGYQDVLKFKSATIKEARSRGYIRTLAGRKRRLLPDIRSDSPLLRGSAERQAFNTKIQGSAADVIKLAMVAMEDPLRELGAQIVIQIHDELVVESPVGVAEDVQLVMQEVMGKPLRGTNPLVLPLITEPTIAERWGDAK